MHCIRSQARASGHQAQSSGQANMIALKLAVSGSTTWPSSSTSSRGVSSAGGSALPCKPTSCSTRWSRRCTRGVPSAKANWCITATAARSPGSTGRRNTALLCQAYQFVECFRWCSPAECLARSRVQCKCHRVQFDGPVRAEAVPFGKYCRSSPLVFSLVPRCHGLWGSQKYTSKPVSIESLACWLISEP